MTDAISLPSLTSALNRRSMHAYLSYLAPRSQPLREYLSHHLDKAPGDRESFLADPVLETRFGWQAADRTMAELAGDLLQASLVRAMDAPPPELAEENRFPERRTPYTHQLASWELLGRDSPLSVLVASGTGSGKTECFLVPILNDLARQAEGFPPPSPRGTPGGCLVGVQAIFLYPLNALINSQRDRLRAWTAAYDGNIRFCLYNGETPEGVPERIRQANPAQVMERRELREDPPPILVTNATMLEYMLVRRKDSPILAKSQGLLRWIVIDEAHTYVGSQAAELSLLLRRVMHAFGVKSADVRFVATSATIGDAEDDDTRDALGDFLSDLAGIKRSQVYLLNGTPLRPEIPAELAARDEALPGRVELEEMDPEQRYRTLASNGAVRRVRQALMEDGALKLSSLKSLVTVERNRFEPESLLSVLDLASRAKLGNDRLIPLRAHLFHRTTKGLWACCNAACDGRRGTALDTASGTGAWPFGRVLMERRDECSACGSQVFELAVCRGCGGEYLAAQEDAGEGLEAGAYYLRPRDLRDDEDDAGEDAWEGVPEEEGEEPRGPALRRQARLIGAPASEQPDCFLDVRDGRLSDRTETGQRIDVVVPEDRSRNRDEEVSKLYCRICGGGEATPGMLFRGAYSGARFLLSVSMPTLLEHLPTDRKKGERRPWDGRRLITFSDSRQGTAIFALRTQTDAERNHVRAMLYHEVLASGGHEDPESRVARIEKLRTEIETMTNIPALASLRAEREAEIASLERPRTRSLSWKLAVEGLARSRDIKDWLPQLWSDLSYGDVSRGNLAEFFVFRELLRRPKRANSLETLGLLALDYPKIRQISQAQVPVVWKRHSRSLGDWQTYLTLIVDFFLRSRSAVNVPRNFLRWLGAPVRTRYVLQPHAEKELKWQIPWPHVDKRGSRSNVVLLLARALHLDLKSDADRTVANEILEAAWDALRPMLKPTAEGFFVHLDEQAELVEIPEGWICPVTQRLLSRALDGKTPYQPSFSKVDFQCRRIRMPRVPYAFWQGDRHQWTRAEIFEWLNDDEAVREARRLGVWTDLNDRIVALSPYFRAAEHSAQQSSGRLRELEADLKRGRVNVLSCSTTMEMGVDIGGISAVGMNNTPPSPANFLQRAGRAGRRDEPIAVSLTMCRSTPHGEMVFDNPRWPFETPIFVPRVSLQSERIVWRHVFALTLARYLTEWSEDDIVGLTAGWFFDPEGEGVNAYQETPADAFQKWCQNGEPLADERFVTGLYSLLWGTALAGQEPATLLEAAAVRMEESAREFIEEALQMRSDLAALRKDGAGDRSAGVLAINRQLDRLRGEYLLGELASDGFLPGYGFPTDVVPFIHTTLKQLRNEQKKRQQAKKSGRERDDVNTRRRGYPTRPLSYAIREYAPGNDVVFDGRVYRSEGVTLSWHIPPGDRLVKELQAFRWAWWCVSCGSYGTTAGRRASCPECGTPDFKKMQYLKPSGFAVRIGYEPHNDVSYQAYVPVKEPWISAGKARWCDLPASGLGRYRYSPRGFIYHYSRGTASRGFAVCLRCGRAASHGPKDDKNGLPREMSGHTRLRGGKETKGETRCPGNDVDWGIKAGLSLGVESQTDVFELELRDLETGQPIPKEAAYSIAVALREALAEHLGIDSREVSCITSRIQAENSSMRGHSIILFDTAAGGAGFVAAMPQDLAVLLRATREKLECQVRECDRACQACLLTYDSQHHDELLDRHKALKYLTDEVLDSLKLADGQRYLGEDSEVEMATMADTVRQAMSRPDAKVVRFFLAGDAGDWDLEEWALRSDIQRWSSDKRQVVLCVARDAVEALDTVNAGALGDLIRLPGVEGQSADAAASGTGGGWIVAEVGGKDRRTMWATGTETGLVPGTRWGTAADGELIVRLTEGEALAVGGDGERITLKELRRPFPGTASQLQLTNELDGSIQDFGHGFWQAVLGTASDVRARFKQGQRLVEVRYSDRYIVSPLVARLLNEAIHELKSFPGLIDNETRIVVRTTFPRARDSRPRRILHNWIHQSDARTVIEGLLCDLEAQVDVDNQGRPAEVPHHRELTLRWQDGTSCWLRPDHGFGFWKAPEKPAFDFDEEPSKQVEALNRKQFKIAAGQSHPTIIYISAIES